MPSTLFEPFHVYELNQRHPAAARLPFKHFLCLTQPEFNTPQPNFNVVGFPILLQPGRITDKRLRLPLRTHASQPAGELIIPGGPVLAIDLLQPMNSNMLHTNSIGQLMVTEIEELKKMALRFLAL